MCCIFIHHLTSSIPDVQAGFRKGRGTRDQIANICWIMEKARELQKNISFCFIDYLEKRSRTRLAPKRGIGQETGHVCSSQSPCGSNINQGTGDDSPWSANRNKCKAHLLWKMRLLSRTVRTSFSHSCI